MKTTPPFLDPETYQLSAVSDNPLYGYSESCPIQVGGDEDMEGPRNERRVLNALLGPKGEKIHYHRTGSLCTSRMKDGVQQEVILDCYVVWSEHLPETRLYFNMYEYGEIKAPRGFSYRRSTPLGIWNMESLLPKKRRLDEWGFEEEPGDFE